jgi:septal ring factor EnvC (AmiA/AmiB activator)
MGLGSATKKIQQVADMAEKLYERLDQLRTQVNEVSESVAATRETVDRLEHTVERQGAVLEALAEQEGVDVDRLYAEAAIDEAEPEADEATPTGDGTD